MPVAFPAIQPQDRDFEAARWPTTSTRSRSGFTSVRQWGSRPADATLGLRYRNITSAQLAELYAAHHAARGEVLDLTIPTIVFQGASTTLRSWLDASATGAGLRWYFAPDGGPRGNSAGDNIHNCQVRLIAQLRLPGREAPAMAVKTSATALVQFKPTTAGGYVNVGKIRDIRFDIRRDALETTGVGEKDRTYRYGIRGTSGSGTLLYVPNDVAAVDMASRILSDDEELSGVKMILDTASTAGTLEGDALITSLSPGVSVGDLVSMPVQFTISGKPTGQF